MKLRTRLLGNSFQDFSWRIFLIWAFVGVLVAGLNITVVTVKAWDLPDPAREFFLQCLLLGDFIFMALTSWIILSLYSQWVGWARALASLILIGLCGTAAEWVGTKIGFPFGDYHYTSNMGPMIAGQVPWAIPCAWWTVVGSLHLLTRRFLETTNPYLVAGIVAAIATGFDYIMEPYAWQIRAYWIWHDGSVPILNYVSWFVLSFVFSVMLTALGADTPPRKGLPVERAAIIMVLMTGLFILGRLVS